MALQLRYFTPKTLPFSRTSVSGRDQPGIHVTDLLIKKVLSINSDKGSRGERPSPELERDEYLDIDSETVREKKRRRGTTDDYEGAEEGVGSASSSSTDFGHKKRFSTYRVISYLLIKLRYFVTALWHLLWRFAELHLHKMVILSLFIVAQYEVSLSYLVVVCFIFLATPLQLFNTVSYPIMTLYLGVLALGKFLFQLSVVGDVPFAFNATCNVSW